MPRGSSTLSNSDVNMNINLCLTLYFCLYFLCFLEIISFFFSSTPGGRDPGSTAALHGQQGVHPGLQGVGLQPSGLHRVVPGALPRVRTPDPQGPQPELRRRGQRHCLPRQVCPKVNHNIHLKTESTELYYTILTVCRPSHHHSSIICRGSNEEMQSASSKYVEDHHRMEIFCKYYCA